jgi:radical SAM superfamily enzyme YgiQ (UPF0313 family)
MKIPSKQMRRAVLLYPVNTFMPPLGLCTLAAILERKNITVNILPVFDYVYNQEKAMPQEVINKVRLINPDMIGIGFMSAEWKPAKLIIESLNKIFPEAVIVVGGRHASNFPLETLLWGADYVVVGEGETTLSELTDAFLKGEPVTNIQGLAFIETDNKMHLIMRSEEKADLDIIPAYHLIPYQKFIDTRMALVGRYLKAGWLTTSRGCFSNCIYCRDSNFGRQLRFRSMNSVMEDMRLQLKNYDLECFYIIDDMFAINEGRVTEFCNRFINLQREFKKKLSFAATARTDTLTESIAESLKRAGCTQLSIGAESGSQRILDFLNTKKKVSRTVSAFEILKGKNIDTFVNFIVGVPIEEERDLIATIELINKIRPNLVSVSFLTAYPGTPLYGFALESGWINKNDFSSYSFKHSDIKAQLNFGVSQSILDGRKKMIYSVSLKSSLANLLLKKEFYRLIIDLLKMLFSKPNNILSLIKSLSNLDVDKLKESYRYMVYSHVWS